jgi:hypothetical protein
VKDDDKDEDGNETEEDMDEDVPLREKATNKRSAAQAKPASKGTSPKEQLSTITKPLRPKAVAKGSQMAVAAKADEAPGGGNVEVQPEQGNKWKSAPIDDETVAACYDRTLERSTKRDRVCEHTGVVEGIAE